METVFSQIAPWLFLLSLGSGMGVPLGIPPGPEDPVIAQVAPRDCVFYTTWSAAAAADSRSRNQAEQMLAEPEVRLFIEHLEKWLRRAVNQSTPNRDVDNLSDATFDTLLMVLRHQTALFVSEVKFKGKRVSAKGGMVVALGRDAPAVRRLVYRHVQEFFINLNVDSVETELHDGEKWYRVRIRPHLPGLLVGIKDSYLIVAVGEDSPDAIVRRMKGSIPAWLIEARRRAGFQRPVGLTYINLHRLRKAGAASNGPQHQKVLQSLGITQAPWVMSASGLVGRDVVTRTFLPIEGEPRGLLLLAAGRGLTRDDLTAIPRDATMALAARLDLQKTWEAVQAAAKVEAEEKETAAKAATPLLPDWITGNASQPRSLPPDAFKSLSDRWCLYNSPQEGGMVLTGLTGVVPITHRQQFSKHYEALAQFALQSLPADDGSGSPRVRCFPFAGAEVHYAGMGEFGLAPSWWAGDKQLVFALTPQSVKACLSRPDGGRSLADVPEIAAELSGREPLLALGYLDAPRVFETVYPLLLLAAPSYLGASGMSEGRREMSVFPSLPSVSRHLLPGITTLRRTDLGLELTSRGSMPGFGLAAPVMFLAWDSQWLNLVFGPAEDNAPPIPMVVPAGPAPAAPPTPAVPPALGPPR